MARACQPGSLTLASYSDGVTPPQARHCAVPGGGLAPDGKSWVSCRPGFFLPVRVLSRPMRRRFLEELQRLRDSGKLKFFGVHAGLADNGAFTLHERGIPAVEYLRAIEDCSAGDELMLVFEARVAARPVDSRP